MATFEFKLPDIGEGVTEGEIVSWLVAVGDQVAEDQDMVEVMTDKATVTIGAPKAGKIAELRAAVGDVVPVGETLVVFELDGQSSGQSAPAAAPEKKEERQESAATAVGDIKDELPGFPREESRPAPQSAGGYHNDKPLAAPATRKLARELGVDLRQVPPSGAGGRVTREDVEAFAGGATSSASSAAARAPEPAPLPISPPVPAAEDRREPIRGLRKRIFEKMALSKRTVAHFTYADEVECTKLIELRNRCKPYAAEAGVKLTFLPFIVKAVVAALKKHPELNAWTDDTKMEIVRKGTYDIGIAAATDAGLIVPVLRGADRLSIIEIAREIERLATEARAGKTRQEDVGGATFTITSLGKIGGLFATPVVNYPEVGILFIPEMKKKPVVIDDEIRIGHVMTPSLSFDHRIIDGHVGAAFAQSVIALLADPDRLMVEMA
ncbi:MAG: 2-oxo acid dehydrogenase subunit E2 [Myxococcales bacterium]|jgi:pyruvate dehydrogenase E2 component (dihydrolipoamide acetyltransferase)|nr:2-oxo acid dehydrogenase subunit E2 [Myxococcales bacterium]